jgi:ribosomal protein S19
VARVRSIANPHQEGKHVTLAEARSAFRELSRDSTPYFLKKVLRHAGVRLTRGTTVTTEMVGYTLSVDTGRKIVPVHISGDMVGHKLGEFVTRAGRQRVGSKAKSTPKAR